VGATQFTSRAFHLSHKSGLKGKLREYLEFVAALEKLKFRHLLRPATEQAQIEALVMCHMETIAAVVASSTSSSHISSRAFII
jgi:hypothetical protein